MENGILPCPVCGTGLMIRLAHGRRSGKPFVMLICPEDGRHIRAFINNKEFVAAVLTKLENKENCGQDTNGHPDAAKAL